MPHVTSADGTRIAYETHGTGPALICVDGAMCYRGFGSMHPLAELLKDRFTVYLFDRRGRGESGNTLPYAPEREVEDIAALLEAAGGEAFLYGISSGAALALRAASALPGISKLALYEAPFVVDTTETAMAPDFRARMESAIAAGRPGVAVRMFMARVRVPWFVILMMRLSPAWKQMTAVGVTLPHDIELVETYQRQQRLTGAEWAGANMPALVMGGGKSPAWMQNAQKAIAAVLPDATHKTLPGQTHMIKFEALAPALREFF